MHASSISIIQSCVLGRTGKWRPSALPPVHRTRPKESGLCVFRGAGSRLPVNQVVTREHEASQSLVRRQFECRFRARSKTAVDRVLSPEGEETRSLRRGALRQTGNRAARIPRSRQWTEHLKELGWRPLLDPLLRDWLPHPLPVCRTGRTLYMCALSLPACCALLLGPHTRRGATPRMRSSRLGSRPRASRYCGCCAFQTLVSQPPYSSPQRARRLFHLRSPLSFVVLSRRPRASRVRRRRLFCVQNPWCPSAAVPHHLWTPSPLVLSVVSCLL